MSPGEMKKLIYMMVLLSTQTLTTLFFIASLPVIMEILDCVQKTSLLMNTSRMVHSTILYYCLNPLLYMFLQCLTI